MMRRILALSNYLFFSLFFSIGGLLYFLLALSFFIIFLDPRQQTPDPDYFLLAIGIFGVTITFLVTLSIAGYAGRAANFPLIVRLPSRAEYLAAVLISSIGYALLIQLIVALASLLGSGPNLSSPEMLETAVVWVAADILFSTIALHASDLVVNSWSRVYVFGMLAFLLYAQYGIGAVSSWLADKFRSLAFELSALGLEAIADRTTDIAGWLSGTGPESARDLVGLVFWPFGAVAEAAMSGHFSLTSALAPALFLMYATALFLLAARFFAYKDLFLSEK